MASPRIAPALVAMAKFCILLQYIVPQHAISRLVGVLARLEVPGLTPLAIRLFVKAYGVDMSEAAASEPQSYHSFNLFFTRALKPDVRPLPSAIDAVVCPADGRISQLGRINAETIIQAKGIDYSVTDLCDGDSDMAAAFTDGAFATIYLAPRNYHRVHMPIAGNARWLRYVPGALFSVNETITGSITNLFCRNERVIVTFDGERGAFALVMVGAMNVGSIELAFPDEQFHNRPAANYPAHEGVTLDGRHLARGAEFGRFSVGSTVILLTGTGMCEWNPRFASRTAVRVGQQLSQ